MSVYYYVNRTETEVSLEVRVMSVGTINTTTCILKRHGGASVPVADSGEDDSGDIETVLGSAATLTGSVLVINTMLNTSALSTEEAGYAYNNAFVNYFMEGGIDGRQHFQSDPNDKFWLQENKIFMISKAIKIREQ